MGLSRVKSFFIGSPMPTEAMAHERIPKWKALAVLSSDALSSVAYATEEILIPLSLLSLGAMAWSMPIALAVGLLLIIITLSYQQTIQCYPHGGGAYTVAKENLGVNAGLIAGASLLIDYILTVAVSVSAGVQNLAAAFSYVDSHKVAFGISIVAFIAIMNLRGIRESSNIFALPTYFFIFSLIALLGVGAFKYLNGELIDTAPILHEFYPEVQIFIILKAFSSGCAALTGIEAISNGVPIFKEPSHLNARKTMIWMTFILGVMFLGITCLSHLLKIVPQHGQTVLSQLATIIFGKGIFFYICQGATAAILILAANTSYADFPRLASLISRDGFLPRQFSSMGDRLVFSNGIIALSAAAAFLIVIFKGDTHHLIPLYAVGVFLSFTLSQSGMIVFHWRHRKPHWIKSLILNLVGAITTFAVLIVIALTKFLSGAWIVVILIPALVILFKKIQHHYRDVNDQLSRKLNRSLPATGRLGHVAVVPISGIHPGVLDAINYALSLTQDVRCCYVDIDSAHTSSLKTEWNKWAPNTQLVILDSPYRSVIGPVLSYLDLITKETYGDMITVVVPEFVTSKWYHQLLHNQTALLLRTALKFKRGKFITSVRYYLD